MNTLIAFPRKSRVASLEAEIRLRHRTRMFQSAAERQRMEDLELLRRSDDYAIKRWLDSQLLTVEPVKQPVSMKALDYIIGLLLLAGGVMMIVLVGAVFAVMSEGR